jgi:hypothetical protein
VIGHRFLWAIPLIALLLLLLACDQSPSLAKPVRDAPALVTPTSTPIGTALIRPSTVPDGPITLGSVMPPLPSDWQVASAALADITGDGLAEWVLVVWRPWQDWPIQRWSSVPSPIAAFHDETGDSCHLILLDPRDGREVWAGSALPVPLLAMVVEDVDRDGTNEVVALEGSYAGGRKGPGNHVDVWGWSGFGFTLEWRSPSGSFDPGCLVDADSRASLFADFFGSRRHE